MVEELEPEDTEPLPALENLKPPPGPGPLPPKAGKADS